MGMVSNDVAHCRRRGRSDGRPGAFLAWLTVFRFVACHVYALRLLFKCRYNAFRIAKMS